MRLIWVQGWPSGIPKFHHKDLDFETKNGSWPKKMTLRKKQTKHHFKATHGISWIWFICDFQPLSWIHGRLSAPLCRSHPAEKTTPQDVSEPKDTRFKWLQRSDKSPFFEGWKPLLVVEPQKRRNSLMNHPWDAKEGKWGGSWKWDWNTQKKSVDRRKFRSQTSDNMDRWKADQGRGREKRKD